MKKLSQRIYQNTARAMKCLFAGALLLTACTKTLELPKIDAEKKIVLVGELAGGELAFLRAGQSLPLGSGSEMKFDIIKDLQLQLTNGGNFTQQLTGTADSMTSALYTIPFTGTTALQPGAHYRLSAIHPVLGTATAEFTMPGVFTSAVTDTAAGTYAGVDVFKINIRINDRADEKNYYVIEALKQPVDVTGSFYFNSQWYNLNGNKRLYDSLINANVSFTKNFDTTYSKFYFRQPVYTTDPHTENLAFGNSLNPSRRILLRDLDFSGGSYTTEVAIDRSGFLATGYIDRGQIVVTVKSVSEDYYNYLVAYEQAVPGLDPDQPMRINGNVSNGLGIVGAVYNCRFIYFFDSWGY